MVSRLSQSNLVKTNQGGIQLSKFSALTRKRILLLLEYSHHIYQINF